MQFVAGISLTCFVASYLVALVLEASRLLFRSGVRGAVMLGFAGAGLVAHSLFLGYRAATAAGTPLSSEFDWYLIAAWGLVATYFLWVYWHPRTAVGLFVLPLVLGLIGFARFFASQVPFPQAEAYQVWILIHLGFQLGGAVAILVGFVAAVMCLVQAWRLKNKLQPVQGFRLPSLEWLEGVNSRTIALSAVLLGLGFVTGLILNLVKGQVPWNDPVIWRSAVLVGWLLLAAVFSATYRPARQGRKLAYLALASFVLLVISIGVEVLLPTAHGRANQPRGAAEPAAERGPSPGPLPAGGGQ